MRRAGRAALVAAAGLTLAAAAVAQEGQHRTTVTVLDHLSAGQQEETITVYFAGMPAGTLHVDQNHPDDSFVATVPQIDVLPFTLCGKLLRQEPDGTVSTHPIDNGGTMTGYGEGVWAAITLGDKVFTLQDDRGAGESTVTAAPACTAAVS